LFEPNGVAYADMIATILAGVNKDEVRVRVGVRVRGQG